MLQTISNVTVTGSDFVQTGGTCEVGLGVPAKGSCTVDVAFKPTSAGFGIASGQLRVDVAPDAPVAVNLSGQKVTAVGFSPSRLAFGDVEERERQYRYVTVANQASFALTLGSPTLSVSSPFSASSQCPATLAAGASCKVRVTVTPTSVGALKAVMRLPVVDPVSGPYTAAVNISATATPTRASVIIGYSAVAVPRSDSCGNPSGRTCESLSGDVISDSLRSTYGTDFAIVNSGSIRADLTCSPGGPSCPVATGAPFAITRGQWLELFFVHPERQGQGCGAALLDAVKADLPGVGRDDVGVEVLDDVLTIKGERKHAHDEKKTGYFRSERSYGMFSRRVLLPRGVDPQKAVATFTDGVLEVVLELPRPEATRGHRLDIR